MYKIGWHDLITWFEFIADYVQDFVYFTGQYLLRLVPVGQSDIQKLMIYSSI